MDAQLQSGTRLLKAAQGGDLYAREALFARVLGKLRLYVEFRLGAALRRMVEVEDVVQETCLRATSDFEERSFAGEGAFYGYLSHLARNVIADIARAARARKRDARFEPLQRTDWSSSGVDRDWVAQSSGPFTKAARSEKQQLLEQAFEALHPRQRRVIALRQFEQRPAKEVAPLLGCETGGAVHALYRRALTAWALSYEALGGVSQAG